MLHRFDSPLNRCNLLLGGAVLAAVLPCPARAEARIGLTSIWLDFRGEVPNQVLAGPKD